VRVVGSLVLVLGLLFGGSGGMWVCVAEEGMGLFAHAHAAEDGCATPCSADEKPNEAPAEAAVDCCDDLLLGGWITALKAGTDLEAAAPSPCDQPVRVLSIAAMQAHGNGAAAQAQAQWPPTQAPALAALATVVLRL